MGLRADDRYASSIYPRTAHQSMHPPRTGSKTKSPDVDIEALPSPPPNVYVEPIKSETTPDSIQVRQSEKFFEAPNLAHYQNHPQHRSSYITPAQNNDQSPQSLAQHFFSPVSDRGDRAGSMRYSSALSPAYQVSHEQHEDGMYMSEKGHHHESEKRMPMMIFGMKWKTFLLVALVIVIVVVGAAVSGAIGGKNLETETKGLSPNATAAASATAEPLIQPASDPVSSSFGYAFPTYAPIRDCPDSNNSLFTSDFSTGSSGSTTSAMGLQFVKYCDLANPLTTKIGEAYAYSFSDCIEVCAGFNFWNNNSNCSVVVYQQGGSRPGNCWLGSAKMPEGGLGALGTMVGTDVALLQPVVS